MSDIIQLLPDSVANQIAAGEVIQRPASIVKELMENSIDAGASSITVRVKDAGKTYVQVVDNGRGMSDNDARLCFERHATSKISEANDLYAIRTMGFRGEALASIAAIAEVSLKTRNSSNEIGTLIRAAASAINSQEPVNTPVGTNITVRNIFFNVPARRKFLKSDQAELRHIIAEFNHAALAYPDIEFFLLHNNTQVFNLPVSNIKKRISGIFGKNIQQNLIDIGTETSIVKIYGYTGKPEYAKKTYGEQFLFVNNRFMKHPYFHKAIMKAYEEILPSDHYPAYFIYFETDPSAIDINIHPTKTEIKFEDERSVWHILHASTKEAIGRHNLSPSLDFDKEGIIDIPSLRKDQQINMPKENINHDFNPFESENQPFGLQRRSSDSYQDWQKLYDKKDNQDLSPGLGFFKDESDTAANEARYLQLKGKYILAPVKSGLMVIDQRRAHERILYEKHIAIFKKNSSASQQTLFPETIQLNTGDYHLCLEILDEIGKLGFEIRDFGQNSIIIHSVPANTAVHDIKSVIETLLEQYKNLHSELKLDQHEKVARSTAIASAIHYGKQLTIKEMQEFVDQLFACSNPNTTPGGRTILNIVKLEDLEKHLA
ncbi:MAG: DNA mismatch repair endonuclease MutL [Bacteroidales bacterium]|nr:DNA mismatch repair endonuclease MutL [Bacteroidales bacterium]